MVPEPPFAGTDGLATPLPGGVVAWVSAEVVEGEGVDAPGETVEVDVGTVVVGIVVVVVVVVVVVEVVVDVLVVVEGCVAGTDVGPLCEPHGKGVPQSKTGLFTPVTVLAPGPESVNNEDESSAKSRSFVFATGVMGPAGVNAEV